MRIVLALLAICSALASAVVFALSKSAIHEILAGVAFLAFACFLSASAVLTAIERVIATIKLEAGGLYVTVRPTSAPTAKDSAWERARSGE